jgi:hypothetical protein
MVEPMRKVPELAMDGVLVAWFACEALEPTIGENRGQSTRFQRAHRLEDARSRRSRIGIENR